MHRFPRFTDPESERLRDAAVEVITKRCAEDAGYLRAFIGGYLGGVEAAVPPVVEQCQQDHNYLTGVVRELVLKLQEQAVLELLHQSLGRQRLSERLGFDPLDRRRALAYRRATRYLNGRQVVVLFAGACVSVLMFLFPPWVEEHWSTKITWGKVVRVGLLNSRPVGYGFWGSYRSRTDVAPSGTDDPSVTDVFRHLPILVGGQPIPGQARQVRSGQEIVYRVRVGWLMTQLLVVWGGAVILLTVFRSKTCGYSDYLRESGASRLEARTASNTEPSVAGRPCDDRIQSEPHAAVDRPRDHGSSGITAPPA